MKKINENGRSMVEMLGVLAIIGVLSVGGIAGYSKAMNKYKINKTTDQVSMLVANLRTIFSSQGNYAGLNNGSAIRFGVVPNDMYTSAENNTYADDYAIKNAFNGAVYIRAAKARKQDTTNGGQEAFEIQYDGLSQEACVTIATGDWGSGQASGLIAMGAGATASVTDTVMDTLLTDDDGSTDAEAGLVKAQPGGKSTTPITVASAVTACTDGAAAGSGYSIMWKYY